MTSPEPKPGEQAPNVQEFECDDTVLRLVTANDLPAIHEAYRLAQHVAQLIRDRLAEAGFPIERVIVIAPSVDDDGRPVVWVYLGEPEDTSALLTAGGGGPPGASPP